MTDKQERPAALTRTRPQPAPDDKVDPVDTVVKQVPANALPRRVASAKKVAPLEMPQPRQPEPVVPLSTRVSLEVSALLKTVTDTGVTQRAAVEHAIKLAYGKDGKKA